MKGETGARHSGLSLEDRALRFIASKDALRVQELHNALWAENPSLTRIEVVDLVWRLFREGKVNLDDAPAQSLTQFLKRWDLNAWFYGSLAFTLITVMVVYGIPAGSPFEAVRWLVGSMLVLFVPGYVMVEALFPKGVEVDSIEHFALGVGLSIALAMLVGLLLNYTPWGIRLTPIMVSLILLTVGLDGIALFRKYAST